MTVAEALVEVLREHGPASLFGYPGAHTVVLHAAIGREPRLRHILVRHEQAAAFAADGFARASGQVGVFVTTAGPGATNTLTAVAESYTNSVPTVHLVCDVDCRFVGCELGAWHEANLASIFRAVTKWRATAADASEAPELLLRALGEAAAGRPRPTQLCVPRDLLDQPASGMGGSPMWAHNSTPEPGVPLGVTEAARLLSEAERPVIIAGGGAVGGARELEALARALGAGVAATCMGKGVFPEDDPLSLGASFGEAAFTAVGEADACLAVGCRFTQVGTRNWHLQVPEALVHIDIDPAVLGMHYVPRVGLIGDARETLTALAAEVEPRVFPDRAAWRERVAELRQAERLRETASEEGALSRALRKGIPREALVVGDVASLVYHMFRHFDAYEPRSFLYPAGYIAMGYGLPAAIGAQCAQPERPVVCITGDGSFHMTGMELATVAQNGLPVKLIVLNNNMLGAVAHFGGPSADDLAGVIDLKNPDFVALARAFGIRGGTVACGDAGKVVARVRALMRAEGPGLLEVRLPGRGEA